MRTKNNKILTTVIVIPIMFLLMTCKQPNPLVDPPGPTTEEIVEDTFALLETIVSEEDAIKISVDFLNSTFELSEEEGFENANEKVDRLVEEFIQDHGQQAWVDLNAALPVQTYLLTDQGYKVIMPNTESSSPSNSRYSIDEDAYIEKFDDLDDNVIFYTNGINTTFPDFKENMDHMYELINTENSENEVSISFVGQYNPTLQVNENNTWINLGYDLVAECIPQKVDEVYDFFDTGIPLIDLTEDILNPTDLETLASLRNALDSLTSKLHDEFLEILDNDQNLIIVPHSQGNFYVRDVLSSNDIDSNLVSVVQLGSPAGLIPNSNSTRISVENDLVALIGNPFGNTYPYDGVESEKPLKEHMLITSYLVGESYTAIRNRIIDALIIP